MATIHHIPPGDIEIRDRLRPENEGYTAEIARNADPAQGGPGIRQPIEIRRGGAAGQFILVAGVHRLRAAQVLNLQTIPAIIVEANEREARLLEIDENLVRNDLSELDRAIFLAERQRVYEELHPEAKHGKNQHSAGSDNLVASSFSTSVAEKLGLSARSIQRALTRNRLDQATRDKVRKTWIADSGAALDDLLKIRDEGDRLRVAATMLGEGLPEGKQPPRTVAAARALCGLVRPQEVKPASQGTVDQIVKAVRPLRGEGTRGQLVAALLRIDWLRQAVIDELHQRGDVAPVEGRAS